MSRMLRESSIRRAGHTLHRQHIPLCALCMKKSRYDCPGSGRRMPGKQKTYLALIMKKLLNYYDNVLDSEGIQELFSVPSVTL